MMFGISVEQPSDHALILGVMLLGLGLEELDAALAQSKRYFDALIPKNQIFRARKEIGNDFKFSERFVCVFDFRAHRFTFHFANSKTIMRMA